MLGSLPSWECGLKSEDEVLTDALELVTPFVGVWIEISMNRTRPKQIVVTPFVGVWIEIFIDVITSGVITVTPFVGVWIEIYNQSGHYYGVTVSLPSWECGLK